MSRYKLMTDLEHVGPPSQHDADLRPQSLYNLNSSIGSRRYNNVVSAVKEQFKMLNFSILEILFSNHLTKNLI